LSSADIAARAAEYGRFHETLTPESLGDLDRLCAPDVRFTDPFNDLTGIAALRGIYEHMYAVLDGPAFVIDDIAVSGKTAYFKWTFTARTKGRSGMAVRLVGMTEAHFDMAGRVVAHLDHWDAASQLYSRLPVIGGLFRWLGRRFALPAWARP
jgi:steroid delta-isomerase